MRTILTLQFAALLFASTTSIAATVEYQHPDLTIIAKQEPLDAVLKSLGREMRIYVTIPSGLNPMVNVDIEKQPVKQAIKTLLGDMSYSLEWEEKTGQLVGLTILAGGGESAVAGASGSRSQGLSAEQMAPAPVVSSIGQGAGTKGEQSEPAAAGHDSAMADRDAAMAEHEARMETERAEHEARMVEERAAQEERMQVEVERHDAEHAADLEAYLGSKGLQMPQ